MTEPIRRYEVAQTDENNARIVKAFVFLFCLVTTALYLPMLFPVVIFFAVIIMINQGIRKAAMNFEYQWENYIDQGIRNQMVRDNHSE